MKTQARNQVAVIVKRQDVLPPAVLAKMVGQKWWRMNCHGAKTLNSVPGIRNADVRLEFSTFYWNDKLMHLAHIGKHAWLRALVERADAGKCVSQAARILDLDLCVPIEKPEPRDRPPGTRKACGAKVLREEDGATVRCAYEKDHPGDCKARAKRAREYARA